VPERPEAIAKIGVGHHAADGVGQRVGVARGDQQRAVSRDLPVRGNVTGDRRQPPGNALGHRQAVPLVGGGVDRPSRAAIQAVELVIVLPAEEGEVI